MNEELRNMLAQYLSARAQMGEGRFSPPGMPDQGPNLPELALKGGARPAVSGSYETPMAGGDVSVRGEFSKPNPEDRPNWGASVGYHRKF